MPGFIFFRLVSFLEFFFKFFPFSNVFLILYLQTIRFTINDVLSPPVIKTFYAITLFLVTHHVLRCLLTANLEFGKPP